MFSGLSAYHKNYGQSESTKVNNFTLQEEEVDRQRSKQKKRKN